MKYLIVNADDFGASTGINRAIAECHTYGVVTSTSVMVNGAAAREASRMMRDLPQLSVGLHFDVLGEAITETSDLSDHAVVRQEFARQLERFHELTGQWPTHVDSHRHAHWRAGLFPVFQEMVAPQGVSLRGDGRVRFAGGFYGQPEWLVTDLTCLSVSAFLSVACEDVEAGWLEMGCHPGYVTAGFDSVYNIERQTEVATLKDPSLRVLLADAGYVLASYKDYASQECLL